MHHPWELAMAVRPCGSVHLRDATFLAKTTSYRLHRDRNEALRQEPAKQANSNKTDYFRIKQRNLSVARLEGREEAVGNERCGNCSGTGKCDCTYCGGIGRANYTDTNVLPAGQYPVWCKVSTLERQRGKVIWRSAVRLPLGAKSRLLTSSFFGFVCFGLFGLLRSVEEVG